MPTWGGVLSEIQAELQTNPHALDHVRRRYFTKLAAKTGRDTILYATSFTLQNQSAPNLVTITDEDLQGIMEVIHGLSGPNLDLILHSPGGSIAAAEAIVNYLRSKFEHIRVIVPSLAMSAASMISCSADEIVMGKHSFLGPVDPQFQLQTDLGVRMVAADTIIEQFNRAIKECQDPKNLPAWAPMLRQYGPDLLQVCENASKLSQELVTKWLQMYLFKNDSDAEGKAARVGEWLSKHTEHNTHGRHLSRDKLIEQGIPISHLEEDQEFQDLALSLFHATTHTFSLSTVTKIIENHKGKAFLKIRSSLPPQIPQPSAFVLPIQPPIPQG